jgi:hypothetical protein
MTKAVTQVRYDLEGFLKSKDDLQLGILRPTKVQFLDQTNRIVEIDGKQIADLGLGEFARSYLIAFSKTDKLMDKNIKFIHPDKKWSFYGCSEHEGFDIPVHGDVKFIPSELVNDQLTPIGNPISIFPSAAVHNQLGVDGVLEAAVNALETAPVTLRHSVIAQGADARPRSFLLPLIGCLIGAALLASLATIGAKQFNMWR